VVDLVVGSDLIGLALAIFSSADLADGLDADEFEVGATATLTTTRISYDSISGALSYDADGLGGDTGTQFALLGPGLGLSDTDFTMI